MATGAEASDEATAEPGICLFTCPKGSLGEFDAALEMQNAIDWEGIGASAKSGAAGIACPSTDPRLGMNPGFGGGRTARIMRRVGVVA